ncbi:G-protein coupled receptor 54-like [Antedon mediterranea]|uniref:G-protein coupled receptor 54-like n=1 Tax=Antedon mediterranea TaxID=105859 RepID=UPI003AF94929
MDENSTGVLPMSTIPIASVLSLITLVGIVGNTLVLYIIITNKDMRTITNQYLLHLAITDISLLVFCAIPMTILFFMVDWPFGDFGCRMISYMQFVSTQVTCFLLMLVTIDRYSLIVKAVQSRNSRSIRKARIIIVCIWIVSLLLQLPAAVLNKVTVFEDGAKVCGTILRDGFQQQAYTIYTFCSIYIVPLTVIAICYVRILKVVWMRKSTSTSVSMRNRNRKIQTKKKIRTTKIVLMLVVAFAIFWLPIHAFLLWQVFDPMSMIKMINQKLVGTTYILALCLMYFSSCVNPFIYAFSSSSFQKQFRIIFTKCCVNSRTARKVSTSQTGL